MNRRAFLWVVAGAATAGAVKPVALPAAGSGGFARLLGPTVNQIMARHYSQGEVLWQLLTPGASELGKTTRLTF